MLACTALVGCSDDDVLNNNELENQQAEKMRAYMTFSIASSTNSSRGVGEGTTDGDNHGNAEHSGHESEGITAENTINDILVVFYNTQGNDGFCDLYTMNSSDDKLTYNGYSTKFEAETTTANDNVKTYKLSEPFALNSLGLYKALIVINPANDIKDLTANNKTDAQKHYEKIKTSYADAVTEITGESYNNFMMANRKEITIKVTEKNNDPSNPAQYMEGSSEETMTPAYIEVERVASKITFRPTNNNTYDITETTYKYNIKNGNFWYKDPNTGVYKYLSNLFKAQDPIEKSVYWVYVNEDGTTVRYKINDSFKGSDDDLRGEDEGSTGDGLYEGELSTSGTQITNTVKAQVVIDVTNEEASKTIVYVGLKITDQPTTSNYTVKLEKYALVNLNNKVYYVRHTAPNPATATNENAWGGNVNANSTTPNYLIEPNTSNKSQSVTWETPLEWKLSAAAKTLYNNDFKTVTDDIATNGTKSTYLNIFGTVSHGSATSQVTPSGTGANATNPEVGSVGNLLGYCMENSMLADNQNALTSTSIIFEAQIYDKDGKAVEYMIEWQGDFYGNFAALVEASKGGDDKAITDSPFWKYTDQDYKKLSEEGKETWATELANSKATLYQDGKCYYFSSQIEHYDNDEVDEDGNIVEKGKGIMENAIMRNNIYSLAVTNVNGFGFSKLDLQSGVLNEESTTEQEKVYLTMKAKILPWIVRFNNITF